MSERVLGIDTGGTYTDGVLLDYGSRRVLATHKSLTTKRDLSLGIGRVIDRIAIDDPAVVKMVSISTTLATNAIAEGKGKRVALFLLGYDPELIATFKLERRLATPHFFFFAGGHDIYGNEKEPVDLEAIVARAVALEDEVDAIAVSGYFSPLNPAHESCVFEALSQACDLPIVLGHQLSTKLGSIERATTAALNASLLSALKEFVAAVRRAMARRGIDAPLMVVRGDGTLMSDTFAGQTPVETIHSGPAASAIGGRFLSRVDDALVIDVGGTTTDIALVSGGQVTVTEEGATVDGYKTAVRAARLLSLALGGDSHLTLNPRMEMAIGPERVTPLAYLAYEIPQVRQHLQALARRDLERLTPEWLEVWFLLREPTDAGWLRNGRNRALIEALRPGPLPLPELLRRLDLFHPSQLGAGDLVRQEIVGKAGMTPTDLLHVDGRFARWDSEAAEIAFDIFCRFQGRERAGVQRDVWRRMTEKIVGAILTFLSGRRLEASDDEIGWWLFEDGLYDVNAHLDTRFRLRLPIIGIGAPAGIVLEDVAAALHTDLILPEYHEVANAAGAVAASIMVDEEIVIYPRLSEKGLKVIGYYVQVSEGRELYGELEAAMARARQLGRERVLKGALEAGADSPRVLVEEIVTGMDSYRIRAKALGNPRLMK
ncbi:MAG: hydantoinase/oxoprolinase family protein [Candidatus Promineifilaceae bacterium]|nr:hydantoinase/oxoprolinase family protein [Candidatus Promineifilaceae bacterium]